MATFYVVSVIYDLHNYYCIKKCAPQRKPRMVKVVKYAGLKLANDNQVKIV